MVSLLLNIQVCARGHVFPVVSRYFSGGELKLVIKATTGIVRSSHADSRS